MRRWVLTLVLIAAAGLVTSWLPPRARQLVMSPSTRLPVRGAVHVHTRRSDGSGTVDDVAAAAARAGLQFVIVTDHGDAATPPHPPQYRHGVLCIDAIEVGTTAGHVLALGLAGPTPYPLVGDPRDVLEDIARFGGMSVLAHPTSPRRSLRWEEWSSPVDGIEWLNADSEWRNEPVTAWARALLTYPIRRSETMAAFVDRPDEALARWDELTARRRVVAIAGADAHASLGLSRRGHRHGSSSFLAVPGYEASFQTFSVTLPSVTLTGVAAIDASAVLTEIRRGHLFSSIDGRASPGSLRFSGRGGEQTAQAGDVIETTGTVRLTVETNAPEGSRIDLLRGGRRIASSLAPVLHYEAAGERAVYRVEVYLPGNGKAPMLWLLSNPIYVGGRGDEAAPAIAGRVPLDPELIKFRQPTDGCRGGASAGVEALCTNGE